MHYWLLLQIYTCATYDWFGGPGSHIIKSVWLKQYAGYFVVMWQESHITGSLESPDCIKVIKIYMKQRK